MAEHTEDAQRTTEGNRHIDSCNHALCPCYLAGLRTGVGPTGAALLRALETVDSGGTDG